MAAPILGIGTDIVKIDRIEAIYKKFDKKFLEKSFHSLEIDIFYTQSTMKRPAFLAKRFAGKEAVAKALGTGIRSGLNFKDIAIVNNDLGMPLVKIFGKTAGEFGQYNIHISLSDDYPIALAFAVVSR